jgi:hypothetical protein
VLVGGFQLADDKVLYKRVQAQTCLKPEPIVAYQYAQLPLESKTSFLKLVAEAGLIDLLQQSRPEGTMHPICSFDHGLANTLFFVGQRGESHPVIPLGSDVRTQRRPDTTHRYSFVSSYLCVFVSLCLCVFVVDHNPGRYRLLYTMWPLTMVR